MWLEHLFSFPLSIFPQALFIFVFLHVALHNSIFMYLMINWGHIRPLMSSKWLSDGIPIFIKWTLPKAQRTKGTTAQWFSLARLTFWEVAWIFTHQGHFSQVSTRGETDCLTDWLTGQVNDLKGVRWKNIICELYNWKLWSFGFDSFKSVSHGGKFRIITFCHCRYSQR